MQERDTRIVYPPSPKGDVVDVYHGLEVPDPYRWLEDVDAPEIRDWIEAQNRLTESVLSAVPERDRIRARLTELWDYEKFGVPWREGGRYFFFRNDGLQNQSVLYTLEGLDAEPRALLDPNLLSADGTVALTGVSVSKDGRLLAYALSTAGSDWQVWRVREVETGDDLPDVVEWSKFSGASWTHDNAGFFYSRYDEPRGENALKGVNYYQKLCYHRLGTPQSRDEIVYERPDHKEWGFGGRVTDDGRYLVISVWEGTDPRALLFYRDLEAGGETVELIRELEATYAFVGNDGPIFWLRTNLGAPRGRLIAIDTREPEREHWVELVPQGADTLESVSVVGDRFIAAFLADAHSRVAVFALDGRFEREVALPGLGTVDGFDGERADRETFYSYTSFTTPTAIYRYDVETGRSTLFRRPRVAFNPDAFETRQVFYTSGDGTRVPMFVTHRRGLELHGRNPVYLYGYGGFNVSLTPAFSVGMLVWMEMGGVFAQANLRGGGEYGHEWHQAGTRLSKQNVFDDFIAAAEWLVENRYTCASRLAIGGGSNGGLLVGAVMTQRPELFGAAVPSVGVLDMLRFHEFTIGWAWVSDYGSADDPEELAALLAYSPLHNVRPGTAYPATLVMTGDHDDRVFPAHSYKFAAALQAAQGGPAPVLIRIETRAGHGAGKPTTKLIDETADKWAFLVAALGIGR